MSKELSPQEVREVIYEHWDNDPDFRYRLEALFDFTYQHFQDEFKESNLSSVALTMFVEGIVAGNSILFIWDE